MTRFARVIVGYRSDLDLSSWIWHRLIMVLLVCFGLVTAAVTFGAFAAKRYNPRGSDIMPIVSLREMTKSAPAVLNTIPQFLTSEGTLGALKDGWIHEVQPHALVGGICSSDLHVHLDELARVLILVPAANADITPALAKQFLDDERKTQKAGEDKRYCYYDGEAIPFMSSEIIKYHWTWMAYIKHYGSVSLKTVGVLGTWMIVLLNLYYRGLVYIVYGSRKDSVSPPPEAI